MAKLNSQEYAVTYEWPSYMVGFSIRNDKDKLPKVDRVIFNPPATVVFWKDEITHV